MSPSIFTQLIPSTFCSIYSKDFTVFPPNLDFFFIDLCIAINLLAITSCSLSALPNKLPNHNPKANR